MIALPDFKAGTTFSVGGIVNLPVADWEGTCHFRDRNNNLQKSIPVIIGTKVTEGYPFSLIAEADDTAEWRTGKMDVRFEDESGMVMTTPTLTLTVIRSETVV